MLRKFREWTFGTNLFFLGRRNYLSSLVEGWKVRRGDAEWDCWWQNERKFNFEIFDEKFKGRREHIQININWPENNYQEKSNGMLVILISHPLTSNDIDERRWRGRRGGFNDEYWWNGWATGNSEIAKSIESDLKYAFA